VVQVGLLKKAAEKLGFSVVEGAAPDSAGILQAAQSLVGRVDAIYLPTDNAVVSGMETIVNVALDQKIPLYPADDNSVRKGGVASLSLNYYELGRLTGRMAARILKGKADPGGMPVEALSDPALVVNSRFAQEIALALPPAVVERAKAIIK
jgi:putative ABC transport system substrate-binding protein